MRQLVAEKYILDYGFNHVFSLLLAGWTVKVYGLQDSGLRTTKVAP
jgi:hypothetical protein